MSFHLINVEKEKNNSKHTPSHMFIAESNEMFDTVKIFEYSELLFDKNTLKQSFSNC